MNAVSVDPGKQRRETGWKISNVIHSASSIYSISNDHRSQLINIMRYCSYWATLWVAHSVFHDAPTPSPLELISTLALARDFGLLYPLGWFGAIGTLRCFLGML